MQQLTELYRSPRGNTIFAFLKIPKYHRCHINLCRILSRLKHCKTKCRPETSADKCLNKFRIVHYELYITLITLPSSSRRTISITRRITCNQCFSYLILIACSLYLRSSTLTAEKTVEGSRNFINGIERGTENSRTECASKMVDVKNANDLPPTRGRINVYLQRDYLVYINKDHGIYSVGAQRKSFLYRHFSTNAY